MMKIESMRHGPRGGSSEGLPSIFPALAAVRRTLSIEELEESDISGNADQPPKACTDRRPSRDRTVSAERSGSPHTIQRIRTAQIRPRRTLDR